MIAPDVDEPKQMVMRPDGWVLDQFIKDWSFVTGIMGPWGSGKSTACVGKLFMGAAAQEPDRNDLRRTRWAVVRDSYPNLQETTIKTWLDWFPEAVYGPMRRSRPMQHILRLPGKEWVSRFHARTVGRPTTIEAEVLFLALMDDDDRKKLLSMELTGAWINEARDLLKAIIDDVIGRTGRYPSMRDGGATWAGVMMDTNAPPETHWWPIMAGMAPVPDDMPEDEREGLKKPDNWHFFRQPGALTESRNDMGEVVFLPNLLAENIQYLRGGHQYYLDRVGGKARSWVRVNFCNQLGQLVSGKPVWPGFSKDKHVAKRPILYDPAYSLIVGVDSTGRNPAAVFLQVVHGRWRALAELIGRDVTDEMFARQVKAKVAQIVGVAGLSYEQAVVVFYRDPHDEQSKTDNRTTTQVYQKHGIRLIPAPGHNAIKLRIDTVEVAFDHDQIEISPGCTMLIAGCAGGYRFRKLQIAGVDAYDPAPDKRNGYADVCDALGYGMLGGGAGRAMVSGTLGRPAPVRVVTRYRPGEGREDLWAKRRSPARA